MVDSVQSWLHEIDEALKREKSYRQKGAKIVDLYEAKNENQTPFAILYSNTETLGPSVYNATPIPIVDRRFKDADPVGKASSEVGTRILKFLIEEEAQDYDTFDELMQGAVLGGLLPNRGVTRWRYTANEDEGGGYTSECVYGENVRWDKFFHGYARSWKKVPWIGFEHDMTKDQFKKAFPEDEADPVNPANEGENGRTLTGETRQELSGVELIKVYEIWDKRDRKVRFLSPSIKDRFLKEIDDPLELKGFFPVPRPLNFQRKITTLVPTPLYCQYEQQAKELNEITNRLKAIIKACKVRGFYDNTIDGIDKVLQADDNDLVPIENRSAMPEGMGLDKMLWLMPLSELVQAAQTLYQQREQCKQIIYEITGISDILRGASVASETATAQQIKNQWGTLRLKKFQKEVQRYVRDCLRIMLEIAATKFEIATIAAMTNLKFPTAQDKQQAQMQAEQVVLQAQMTGQPPEIPPQLQELLAKPSWEEIVGLLRNDVLRDYRVEIETNSTIDAEAAQDKQDISELLNAIAQFMNGIAPLVEQGAMPIEVAKGVLLAISRRYTFGPQLEEALEKMQAPQPKEDPAAAAKAQQEQVAAERAQAEFQMDQKKMELEAEFAAADHQRKMELMQMEMQVEKEELAAKQAEVMLQKIKLQNQLAFEERRHEMKIQQLREPA